MAKSHEEAFTSQIECKRGTPQETPKASSLVAAMSLEELRSFSQIPTIIRLEVLDGTATPTIGGVNNVVYFTRE